MINIIIKVMNKKIYLLGIIITAVFFISAKSSDLMQLINDTDFDKAFNESSSLLKQDVENKPFVRYINILASAGKNFRGQINDDDIIELNRKFSHKKIKLEKFKATSGECKTDCLRYMKQNPTELYVVRTTIDSKGNDGIMMMVYITLKNKMTEKEFNTLNNKELSIIGDFELVELKGNLYKRFNLRIKNAQIL